MGLVLCVYEGRDSGDDLDGFQVGSYSDFGAWHDFIVAKLEGGHWGRWFPSLMMHSDCDGEWSPEDCIALKRELAVIRDEMARLPVVPFHSALPPMARFSLTPSSAWPSWRCDWCASAWVSDPTTPRSAP